MPVPIFRNSGDSAFLDVLQRLIPGLRGMLAENPSPKLANLLFNKVWSDPSCHVEARRYRRPSSVEPRDVQAMADAGLVKVNGEEIEITKKGSEIILKMILGNPRSALEPGNQETEYLSALANLKPSTEKLAKRASRQDAGDDWYSRSIRG